MLQGERKYCLYFSECNRSPKLKYEGKFRTRRPRRVQQEMLRLKPLSNTMSCVMGGSDTWFVRLKEKSARVMTFCGAVWRVGRSRRGKANRVVVRQKNLRKQGLPR